MDKNKKWKLGVYRGLKGLISPIDLMDVGPC